MPLRPPAPLVVLLLALVVGALFAGSASATPMVGAEGDITWGSTHAEIDREIALFKSSGLASVRASVSWKGTEPNSAGVLNTNWMSELDYAISHAEAAGLDVLVPLTAAVPYWASTDPAKYTDSTGQHWNPAYPPTSNADYADWARRMAAHFSAMGVKSFEIWNEPNHKAFWAPSPSATAYATLLHSAAAAVRAAAPGARIILGGLSGNDYAYLDALYAAGAKSDFDVVAVHPYSGSNSPYTDWRDTLGRWSKDCFCGLQEIRSVMVARGDSAKPVWATEFGWSTTTAQYGVTEANQATFITGALDRMSTWPWIERAYVYQFRNAPWRKDDPADWSANLGLVRSDFTAKPALAAVQAWTAAHVATTTPTTPTTTTTTTAPTTTTTTTTTTAPTTTTTTTTAPTTTTTTTTTTTSKKRPKARAASLRLRAAKRAAARRRAARLRTIRRHRAARLGRLVLVR